MYNNIQQIFQPSPLPFINSTHTISLDFDGLKAFPESLRLDFPDNSFTIVTKQIFDPRAGYIFRDDEDPAGTPDFMLDPSASAADFSYLWAGTNDQYDVVITVQKGQLVATIAGNSKRYVIQKMADDSYTLTHVYLPGLPSNADDVVVPETRNHDKFLVDNTTISHLKTFDVNNKTNLNKQNSGTSSANTVLDVLIVYTETARIEAGGSASDPDDSADMQLNITQVVDSTNIALNNSETNTRITRFHVAKLNGFTHQGSHPSTLRALKELDSLRILRTNVGADMVSLIIEDAHHSIFNVYGVAYGQTILNQFWTVGEEFNDWSYSVLQQQCVIYDNTFGHELGHLMGAHHVKELAEFSNSQATIDAIVNNGYGYAFAYKSSNFKTLMSVTQATPLRRLYFSNPDKFVDNQFIGNINEADNSRVIDELSPAMSLYKTRPDLIFISGFE